MDGRINLQGLYYYVKSGNIYTLMQKVDTNHYQVISVIENGKQEDAIIHMKEIVNRMYEGGC